MTISIRHDKAAHAYAATCGRRAAPRASGKNPRPPGVRALLRLATLALALVALPALSHADDLGLPAPSSPSTLLTGDGCGCGCVGNCGPDGCGCAKTTGPTGVQAMTNPGNMPATSASLTLQPATSLSPTTTSFTVANVGASFYSVNGTDNPTLTLTRGDTYTFNVSSIGHPFDIKSVQEAGTGGQFLTGVTNEGVQSGTLTFTVPLNAPNTLFYDCEIHTAMTGVINIIPEPGSAALIEAALLGVASLRLRRRKLMDR